MAIDVGQYDFEIYQGNQVDRLFTLKNSDGTLVDLSGFTSSKMQIKRTPLKTAPAIIEASTENGKIIIGNGTVAVSFSSADTAKLPIDSTADGFPRTGTVYYDIELRSSTSERTFLAGSITVIGQVTE